MMRGSCFWCWKLFIGLCGDLWEINSLFRKAYNPYLIPIFFLIYLHITILRKLIVVVHTHTLRNFALENIICYCIPSPFFKWVRITENRCAWCEWKLRDADATSDLSSMPGVTARKLDLCWMCPWLWIYGGVDLGLGITWDSVCGGVPVEFPKRGQRLFLRWRCDLSADRALLAWLALLFIVFLVIMSLLSWCSFFLGFLIVFPEIIYSLSWCSAFICCVFGNYVFVVLV